MTPAQISLLQRLIAADREYRKRKNANLPCDPDERGVEVNFLISGVHEKTAKYLVEQGLAEIVNIREGQNWIFLGKYNPFDDIEE